MRLPGVRALHVMVTALVATMVLAGCGGSAEQSEVDGGSIPAGREQVRATGCAGCHIIPGVDRGGRVGPPLEGFADRAYIAGTLANTPENLVAWLQDPQGVQPGSGMPDVGLDEQQARDIAAYLRTLGER